MWSAVLTACLTSSPGADPYVNVVGATVLPDGAIVVLPSAQTDGGDAGPSSGSDEPSVDTDAGAPADDGPPPEGCDLSGRWLVSERAVTVAMGIRQLVLSWRYYEITQRGERLEVTRGLTCGRTSKALGELGANGDLSGQWPALLTRVRDDGRIGSVKRSADGCVIDFPKRTSVGGATMPYYLDAAVSLPKVSEQAEGGRPGWEDWDGDGKPGVAVKITGFANGVLHASERSSNAWSGSAPSGARDFKLALRYAFQTSVLLIEGSELLGSSAAVDPDASLQFVRFVRLGDTQASQQDESALCAEIRTLAPELAPDANR